jgi:CRP/FNR family transcriptional activator FtrB
VRTRDIEQVRALPLFDQMTSENFGRLTDAAFLQQFPAGVTLFHEGSHPDFLHILVDGLVEIVTEQSSGTIGISLVRPTTTLILAAVIVDQPYLNSARTLSDSRVLLLPAERVREVFGLDASFARAMVRELAFAYRGAIKKLKGQMARSSTERLANWILSELQASGEPGSFKLPFDRATLASHIGMTRENLSRSLAQLTDHGLRVQGREILVDDPVSLERFAKPQALIDDPNA